MNRTSFKPDETTLAAAFVAAKRLAEKKAILAAEVLDRIDARLKAEGISWGTRYFPSAFLLELGAVCLMRQWLDSGIARFLPDGVLTFSQAHAEFCRRLREDSQSFRDLGNTPLSRQVTRIWLQHLAWAGPEVFDAEVVVGPIEEDQFVDAMAQLLWARRQSIKSVEETQS